MEAGYWEAASRRRFLSVFIVLLALLLVLVTMGVLTGTWWTTGIAVLCVLALPIQYYTDARAEHRLLARLAVNCIVLTPPLFVAFFGLEWSRSPLHALAVLEMFLSLGFAGGMITLLCERFLKPRLRPKPLPTSRH